LCADARTVEFEWDPEKAESNFSKHRVHFAEAETIFRDQNLLTLFDDTSDEERYIVIGLGSLGELLYVVYTMRDEITRLISARKATQSERREYEYRK
jgi:uncharacterized DUF497 family protein